MGIFMMVAGWLAGMMAHGQIDWRVQALGGQQENGNGLVEGRRVVTWGLGGIRETALPKGRVKQIAKVGLEGAGCLYDVNGDGVADLAGNVAGGRLVWLEGPRFEKAHLIDTDSSIADCMGMTLLGRRGVLVTHKGLQLRFYEVPKPIDSKWPYREVYSFYTASYQAGLLFRDVDGDGIADLMAGNYWVRSPKEFALPWRLFAINTYSEEPQSAHVRLGAVRLDGGQMGLVVSQGELHPGRLAVFTAGEDVRQLWRERRLDGVLDLNQPSALAVGDLDGDGLEDFVLGERGGTKPRLWWWRQERGGGFRPALLGEGLAIRALMVKDVDGDGRLDVLAVGSTRTVWYRNLPVQ